MSYNKILDNDIKTIKREISKIIELTKSQYAKTFELLKDINEDLANEIIEADKKINDAQNDFTQMALWKIAKQQMVAGDLRLAVGGILISREIERIADYTKKICNFSIKFSPTSDDIVYISKIFDLVNTMLNTIYSMIENYESSQKQKVIELENIINEEFKKMYLELVAKLAGSSGSTKDVEKFLNLTRQLKNLERAGDHLVAVEEILTFIRTGKFEEIIPLEEIK